jgi:hypothetical protein
MNFAHAVDFSGNLKAFGISKDLVSRTDNLNSLQLSTKFQAISSLNEFTKIEIAYELLSVTEKPLPHVTPTQNYRVSDLNYYLHDEAYSNDYKTNLIQNLNRLNLNMNFQYADLSIGRMPIAFGSAKSINPTDVLTPFAVNTIDKEERIGVDAAFIKIPINELSLIEVGFVGGNDLESKNNAKFIRPKFNFSGYDIAFSFMNFKEKNLVGFDLQHSIQDAGFWFESAYVDQTNFRVNDFIRITTGVDYKFSNTLYLAGEYHYNGASGNSATFSPLEFIYLRDFDYFILTSSYEFTPLLTGSIQSYVNLKDKSNLSSLKLDYNFKENLYLSLGSYLSTGNTKTSEFGRYGQQYYSSIRFYY